MGTASLSIPPAAEQVRLARLVAGAAARRCGVDEEVLDEVRLAVGEACALAVVKHQDSDLAADIRIELTDDSGRFSVRITEPAWVEERSVVISSSQIKMTVTLCLKVTVIFRKF